MALEQLNQPIPETAEQRKWTAVGARMILEMLALVAEGAQAALAEIEDDDGNEV